MLPHVWCEMQLLEQRGYETSLVGQGTYGPRDLLVKDLTLTRTHHWHLCTVVVRSIPPIAVQRPVGFLIRYYWYILQVVMVNYGKLVVGNTY